MSPTIEQLPPQTDARVVSLKIAKLPQAQPRVERVTVPDESLSLGEAAKTLGMRVKDLVRHLCAKGYVLPGGPMVPYEQRIIRGELELNERTITLGNGTVRKVRRVRILPDGLKKLRQSVAREKAKLLASPAAPAASVH